MARSFGAGGRLTFDFPDNSPEWARIRTSPGIVDMFEQMGTEWVADLNNDLHQAQAARGQEVADGYDAHITTEGDRARLYIVAESARAQAHEAKHNKILKLMQTSGHDVKKGTGEFKNPGKGFLGNA